MKVAMSLGTTAAGAELPVEDEGGLGRIWGKEAVVEAEVPVEDGMGRSGELGLDVGYHGPQSFA